MQINENEIDPILQTLSVRGRGYFQAFTKIVQGTGIRNAGILELRQLEGDVKNGHVKEITDKVRPLLEKGTWNVGTLKDYLKEGPLGTGALASRVKASAETVRRYLQSDKEVHQVGKGNMTKWALKKGQLANRLKSLKAKKVPKSAKTKKVMKAESSGVTENDRKEVLKALKADSWMGRNKLMSTLQIGYERANLLIDVLVNEKAIRVVEKVQNPNHLGTAAYNRVFKYLELVGAE